MRKPIFLLPAAILFFLDLTWGAHSQMFGGCVLELKSSGDLGQDLDNLDKLSTRINGTPARIEISTNLRGTGAEGLRLISNWPGEFGAAPSEAKGSDHLVNLSLDQEGPEMLLSPGSLHETSRLVDVHMELKRKNDATLIPGLYRVPITLTCAVD